MIDSALLKERGGTLKTFEPNNIIFREGSECVYYYQLVSGRVCWGNSNEEGKEFIQKIIEPGECFGELPLFDDEPYAADAVAIEKSLVIRIPKRDFLKLIHDYPALHFQFSRMLAQRVRYEFFLLKTFALENPENRIQKLLFHFKQCYATDLSSPFLIKLTRQQIADMTGLRVETVIRAIKNLCEKRVVAINQGKVFV